VLSLPDISFMLCTSSVRVLHLATVVCFIEYLHTLVTQSGPVGGPLPPHEVQQLHLLTRFNKPPMANNPPACSPPCAPCSLPELAALKARLQTEGRAQDPTLGAVFMTGSGSTVVGVGSDRAPAFLQEPQYKVCSRVCSVA
jgi:hypothetical protein